MKYYTYVPPEGARVGDSVRLIGVGLEWYGHSLPLSAWPHRPQVGNTLAPSSWTQLPRPTELPTCGRVYVKGPLYSVSLASSGGKAGKLKGRRSSWQWRPRTFYRSAPSSKQKDADPCTQIGPSHTQPGPVDAGTRPCWNSSTSGVTP